MLELTRPIVFFDIESTGLNVMTDRIVELALVKLHPDGTREEHLFRINPQMHIPEEVVAVHHISDEDVAKQVRETLARLTSKGSKMGKGAKYRRDKRDAAREAREEEMMAEQAGKKKEKHS